MKKLIALAFAGLLILTAVPAFAEPSDNASPRAFAAQAINECRQMMNGAVQAGEMTRDQLKACIEMMKTAPCMENVQQ